MKIIRILDKIFQIITPIVFAVIGVLLIVYAVLEDNYEHVLIGVALMVSGAAGALNYIGSKKYNRPHAHDLMEGIFGLSLGIVFLCSETMDIPTICTYWGIYEIVKGALELEENFIEVKKFHNKMAIIDTLLAIIGVIFGILLCVHLYEGLKDHLIVCGVVFLATSALQITDIILEKKHEKKEAAKKAESVIE